MKRRKVETPLDFKIRENKKLKQQIKDEIHSFNELLENKNRIERDRDHWRSVVVQLYQDLIDIEASHTLRKDYLKKVLGQALAGGMRFIHHFKAKD